MEIYVDDEAKLTLHGLVQVRAHLWFAAYGTGGRPSHGLKQGSRRLEVQGVREDVVQSLG